MAGLGIGVIVAMLFGYFLPTLIAMLRSKSNTVAIFALNLFLGWTFVGWIISLVWSLSADNKPQTIVINNHVSERIINPVITPAPFENLPNNQISPIQKTQLIGEIKLKSHQDKINELQQLKQLFDAGILTEEEFKIQKSQILDK